MYGMICDPWIAPCPSRVSLALRVEVSTPCGALLTRGTTVFVPRVLLGLEMYGRIHDPAIGLYPHRMALVLRTPDWGFHIVGGSIDPGDHRFYPRFFQVVTLWKEF